MKSFIYSLILLPFLVPFVAGATSIPAFPMAFWGSVTINNSVAPVGTVVRAYYGNILAGIVTVNEAGVYGYTEPTKQKLVVAEGVGPLSFVVQSASFNGGVETAGSTIVSHGGFTAGNTVLKDLSFTISVPTSTPPSSGTSSGSASSGGGGGGVYVVVQQTSTVKGDGTGDGKVDILDFNTFLIQWGKTGNSLLADFDKNGIVDILDFNLMLINWTK